MRLIDADTAIETLENGKYSPDYCKEHEIDHSISMEMVRILLNTLPPAQPERKTGQWIEHENADIIEGYYVSMYECSCCHTWKNDDSNYCPDCGADMRGKEHETD